VASLFSWGSRKQETAAGASRPDPSAAEAVVSSKVLKRFLSAVAQRPSPVLIDLGPVVGRNIEFFGERLACKFHVADLFTQIETNAQKGTLDLLAADISARLTQAPESADGILCWDVFDFLDRGAGQVLAARLVSMLRKGGALHGFFGTTAIDLAHYTRFVVESENALRLRPYPATKTRRSVRMTGDINKMFTGLAVAESVLLKSSTREVLFRKP
jgi:hypothetical protein